MHLLLKFQQGLSSVGLGEPDSSLGGRTHTGAQGKAGLTPIESGPDLHAGLRGSPGEAVGSGHGRQRPQGTNIGVSAPHPSSQPAGSST